MKIQRDNCEAPASTSSCLFQKLILSSIYFEKPSVTNQAHNVVHIYVCCYLLPGQ